MGIRFLLFSLSPALILLLCNYLARHPHKIYPYSLTEFVGIEKHYIRQPNRSFPINKILHFINRSYNASFDTMTTACFQQC